MSTHTFLLLSQHGNRHNNNNNKKHGKKAVCRKRAAACRVAPEDTPFRKIGVKDSPVPPGGQAFHWRPPAGMEFLHDKGRPILGRLLRAALKRVEGAKVAGVQKTNCKHKKKRCHRHAPSALSLAPSRHQLTGELFWPSAACSTLKSLLAKVWGAPRFPPFFFAGDARAATALLLLLLLLLLPPELLAPKDPRMAVC